MEEPNDKIMMLDSRRNQSEDRKKLYEEMLLKEIPGTSRVNEPMHAVLEGELGESELTEGCEAQNVRNRALIHYLATLANSNSTNDIFDFSFVESLLRNGADVNSTDKTGQTVFHEVARSWNNDVAKFLIENGANVNQQDQFGRSPLHVAAAVNYAEMIEFLLENGADINIRTHGEGQTPIHIAAKNNAINSLEMLLGCGADIDARDSKNRTPLQVAAEMNRSKAAKLLINEGAPAGVCDNLGNSALSLLIEKIPEVALEAMDQFHSTDTINRKEFYFLNYLEGPKLKEEKTPARTPLEIAVQNERFDVILHPVMQRLIAVKWQMYGKWGATQDLVVNLVYTILWTVLGVTLPRHGRDLYLPIEQHSWRLVIGILLILLTIGEVQKQVTNTIKTRRELKKWREWRAAELERDTQYCHPRWPQETQYLQSEIKAVRNLSLISSSDWWIYFDWIALVFILATIISHVTFFHFNTDTSKEVHHNILIPLLLILWFRIFKYARPFESAGPFVVIFGSVTGDIIKWAFLNSIIIVPFTAAFWITFGAVSSHPVKSYQTVSPLLYNVFSMMVVNDHHFDDLEKANPVMARILCGAFIGMVAIVTLNLLIALLTNTFERLYENAVANAVMQRARTILLLRKSLRRKQKKRYYDFIKEKGSPEVLSNELGRLLTDHDERATIERVREDIKIIMNVLGKQFGSKYGKKGKKSDMDFVKMDVSKVKRFQQELINDVKNMNTTLLGIKESIEPLINNNNNNNNNNNTENKTIVATGLTNSSSSFVQPSPSFRSTLDKRTIVRADKHRKKSKKNSEDESETSDSSSPVDHSSETEVHEDHAKKDKHKRKSSHYSNQTPTDHDRDTREKNSKEQFTTNLPHSSTRSTAVTGNKLDSTRQKLAYPPSKPQQNVQDMWQINSRIPAGTSNQAYPPMIAQGEPYYQRFQTIRNPTDPNTQTFSPAYLTQQDPSKQAVPSLYLTQQQPNGQTVSPQHFIPQDANNQAFSPPYFMQQDPNKQTVSPRQLMQQDPNKQVVPSSYLMQQDPQHGHYISDQRLPKNQHAYPFNHPQQSHVNDDIITREDYKPVSGHGFRRYSEPSDNIHSSRAYDTQHREQPPYVENERMRVEHRPGGFSNNTIQSSLLTTMIRKPSHAREYRGSTMVEKIPQAMQKSSKSHEFQNYGFQNHGYDDQSFNQRPSRKYPEDQFNEQLGFANIGFEQVREEPGPFIVSPSRVKTDSRPLHFKQDPPSFTPRSAASRHTELPTQNAMLQERIQSPDPSLQRAKAPSSGDTSERMVTLRIPEIHSPKETTIQYPTRPLTPEDRQSAKNQDLTTPQLNETPKHSSQDEPEIVNSNVTPQIPGEDTTRQAEKDKYITHRPTTPIGKTIEKRVAFYQEKVNETQERSSKTKLDYSRESSQPQASDKTNESEI